MNIILNEFIVQKLKELEQHYRKVELYDIPNVTFRGRTVGEQIGSGVTPLAQLGREISVHEFPQNVPNTEMYKPNGTEVKFKVVPRGKRKEINKSFYFLWEVAK